MTLYRTKVTRIPDDNAIHRHFCHKSVDKWRCRLLSMNDCVSAMLLQSLCSIRQLRRHFDDGRLSAEEHPRGPDVNTHCLGLPSCMVEWKRLLSCPCATLRLDCSRSHFQTSGGWCFSCELLMFKHGHSEVLLTRSQAVARIADRTAKNCSDLGHAHFQGNYLCACSAFPIQSCLPNSKFLAQVVLEICSIVCQKL